MKQVWGVRQEEESLWDTLSSAAPGPGQHPAPVKSQGPLRASQDQDCYGQLPQVALAGAGAAYCQVFPKSTCFACSPEGPRPSHCPLPRSKARLSGFRDLSQPSLEFSLSPNLHSLGPSLGLTWEPGMKAQGRPPWAAASEDDKYPLTQGIPRLSSPS